MGTLSCFMCMLYINLFYLRRSLWYQLNQNKQVFKADSTCTSRSSYLYLWHRLVNLLVLVLAQVGQQRNFTCTCWSTYLYFWPRLVNLLVLVGQPTCTSAPGWSTLQPRCRSRPWSRSGSSTAMSRSTSGWSTSPCRFLERLQIWKVIMILFMDGCNIIKKQNNTYLNSGSPVSSGSGTSSRSAGKSLLKTKVVSYLNSSSS